MDPDNLTPADLETTLNKISEGLRRVLLGMNVERRNRDLLEITRTHAIAKAANDAYKAGMPRHEGPVYSHQWMTDYWQHVWDQRKAYEEGRVAKESFVSEDNCPYTPEGVVYTKKALEFERSWYQGFNGEEFWVDTQ